MSLILILMYKINGKCSALFSRAFFNLLKFCFLAIIRLNQINTYKTFSQAEFSFVSRRGQGGRGQVPCHVANTLPFSCLNPLLSSDTFSTAVVNSTGNRKHGLADIRFRLSGVADCTAIATQWNEALHTVSTPECLPQRLSVVGSCLVPCGHVYILPTSQEMTFTGIKSESTSHWQGSSVGQSVVPILQSHRFDPRSGHIQEATHECINKWNNKLMFLSLPSIKNKKKFLKKPRVLQVLL